MRKSIGLLFALCVLAVVATSEGASLFGFESRALCASPSGSLSEVPAPQNRNCLEGASCSTSQECANLCSGYSTANCVEGQCQYTYGGGSGGSGGSGDACYIPSPMECTSYQQCVCQRPSGIYDYGQCINGYCQF